MSGAFASNSYVGGNEKSQFQEIENRLSNLTLAIQQLEENESQLGEDPLLRQLFTNICPELSEIHLSLSVLILTNPRDSKVTAWDEQYLALEERYSILRSRWSEKKLNRWLKSD